MERPNLEVELQFFAQHRQEWLHFHLGDFAVVAGTTVAGFYSDYQAAFEAGLRRFGILGSFLVKQVCLEEPTYFIGSVDVDGLWRDTQ